MKRYEQSGAAKQRRKKYERSEKGKLKDARYNKAYWAVTGRHHQDKALAMAERMTPHQRTRFADWLLRKRHKLCSNGPVDYNIIAPYNSQGV